ncbi:ATP-binding cassette domain-containing protein [Haliovirga abyssi]|uniref:ABC transporter ATP-binding protein n=1 Tax=Haliovirga abyssi TaxID=2996794 RepID=A0AAU9DEN5_9FUSO|nr:ATP-binding cassette domain-containing protein [Haliovirga abyssi]BDU50822.1 ABC transporter ATP-binding protein [Haliovirga abyssi]
MLKIENLNFGYGFKKNMYENLSLELKKGKIYGILGRNGSGKTTLLKMISSLLVGYDGNIMLDGEEAKKRSRNYLKKIFYLPEVIEKDDFKVKDLIILGRCYENWNETKFLEFIEREKINKKKKIKSFSKGWKKRIWFYYSVAVNPKVLILDEVSEGIDIIAQKEVIRDILEYFNEEKIILIASHHIEEFENILDEFIVIDNGNILYKGEKDYVDQNFGWAKEEESKNIEAEDIINERKIFDEKYILVQNIKKYSDINFKNIDIATFLESIIKMKGDNNYEK